MSKTRNPGLTYTLRSNWRLQRSSESMSSPRNNTVSRNRSSHPKKKRERNASLCREESIFLLTCRGWLIARRLPRQPSLVFCPMHQMSGSHREFRDRPKSFKWSPPILSFLSPALYFCLFPPYFYKACIYQPTRQILELECVRFQFPARGI